MDAKTYLKDLRVEEGKFVQILTGDPSKGIAP